MSEIECWRARCFTTTFELSSTSRLDKIMSPQLSAIIFQIVARSVELADRAIFQLCLQWAVHPHSTLMTPTVSPTAPVAQSSSVQFMRPFPPQGAKR